MLADAEMMEGVEREEEGEKRHSSLRPKIAYYYDADVGNYSYGLGHPMKPHRMRMVHNLVLNYGMDKHMDMMRPPRATPEQMTRFHTDEYIEFLEKVTPETAAAMTRGHELFLTGEDCPSFEGLFEFCSISAGGSIAAANRLTSGEADVCINWAGGLHHAKKREASGFCYVNDIVLAILELLRYHQRVLYIDIDIHHGDGVEEAFYTTDRVMTCSFHKFPDYFPGTGSVEDTGMGKGKRYAVNFPLRDGIDDETYASVFRPTIQHIIEWYRPGAVVLQCGADSLAGDKLGVFNLSMKGHAACVSFVKSFNLPMIVLGGGGYAVRNVSRTWTYETGLLLGVELDENLPFNDYLDYYGPKYKLEVPETNMENHNTPEYLADIQSKIVENLRSMPFAPSVQMTDVPRDGRVLGDESDDELDDRIRKLHPRPPTTSSSAFHPLLPDSDTLSSLSTEDDDFPSSASSLRRPGYVGRPRKVGPRRRFFAPTDDHAAVGGCGNHEHSAPRRGAELEDVLKRVMGARAAGVGGQGLPMVSARALEERRGVLQQGRWGTPGV